MKVEETVMFNRKKFSESLFKQSPFKCYDSEIVLSLKELIRVMPYYYERTEVHLQP